MAQLRSELAPTGVSRIPAFRTVEEEAEFWDIHSFTDFEDELEEVTDVVFIGLEQDGRLALWLEPEAAAALVKQAEQQATHPATLAPSWILERLGLPIPAQPEAE